MVGDNHLSEIEACYTGSEPLVEDVETMIGDLKDMKFIGAIEQLHDLISNFQADTAACHDLSDDLASIEAWAAKFKDIPLLIETVGKHYLIHQRAIKKDIAAEKADWAAGNSFKAGADIADAVTLALGPMSQAPSSASTRYAMTSPIPGGYINKLLAGFIYGMVGENHLTEIEACGADVRTNAPEVEHELLAAIGDFKHGGWNGITQGVLEILLVALQLVDVLGTCKHMQDDIAAIEAWAKGFTDVHSLIPSVTKHFLLHRKAIEADITDLKADAAAQEWFKTGQEAAEIVTILLPIQAQAEDLL